MILVSILILAFILRIVGFGFGTHYPDEHIVVYHALGFGTGDLNPHMFYYPSLFLYLLFFLYGLFYLGGTLAGAFANSTDFLNTFLLNPQIFYFIGRAANAFLGTLTVWAIFSLGRAYRSRSVGLISALFLAVCFLHVRDSHFATVDISMTFFIVLSLMFLLNGKRYPAAFVAGLAAATKYNAFLLFIPLALAYLIDPWWANYKANGIKSLICLLKVALISAILMFMGFFIFSPFVILDWKSAFPFIDHLRQLNTTFELHIAHHLRMLFHGMEIPLFVMAGLGMVIGFLRYPKPTAVLASFAFVYYGMITKAGQPFERYVLALIPIGVLWAALALEEIISWIIKDSNKKVVALGVAAFLIAGAVLAKTVYSDVVFLQKDTRDMAKDWVMQNVAPGHTLTLDDPRFSPKFYVEKSQIREKLSQLLRNPKHHPAGKKRLEALLELEPYPRSYKMLFLHRNPKQNEFTFYGPQVEYDVNSLIQTGGYLITNHAALVREPDFYAEVKSRLEEVAQFDPRWDKRHQMPLGWTYLPIDGRLWMFKRPGPVIYIYKVKEA
jgi:hypothetical protein